MKLLFKLLMRIGLISSGPAVSSITSATQAEGTSLVHTVTLASAVAVIDGLYPFSLSGVTATSGTDYTATPTFSAGVTRSGNTLTVPVGVFSFTITVSTTDDAVFEGTETYSISVGGMTNTGTITDDESAPTIASVSSASATEGSNIVHTVTVTGTAQASRTFAFAFSGAAVGGTDYNATPTFSAGVTLSGGNITVPAGVTSFAVTVATINNGSIDGSRSYTLTIGGASGTGTVNDDDAVTPAFTATLTALTNATGTVTTLAYINAGSGSLITPAVTVSRSTGVAPLAVHFDASATTATAWTSRPFHELEYRWDFGDGSTSTWQYGAGEGTLLKRIAFGPIASYLYETAGTFTPALQVKYNNDIVTYPLPSVTVTASNTQWAGTKTVCVSTDGDFTGAPAGCTQVTSSNAVTAISGNIGSGDVRILLKRGGTYAVGSRIIIDQPGPGYIGAWGSGAKPIFNLTTSGSGIQISSSATPSMADWRIMDLQFEGNNTDAAAIWGGGSMRDLLVLRNDIRNLKFGLSFSISNLDAINNSGYTHAAWSNFFIMDNTINDLVGVANGSNGMYLSLERSAVMGNYVNPNNKGEHGIRAAYESYSVFSHNEITGIPSGRAFLTLRSPDQGGATFPSGTYGTYVYSEKNYVSDNRFYGGYTTGMSGVGPTNGTATGRSRDFVWERNLFEASATTNESLNLAGVNITARNNLFKMTGGAAIGTQPLANSPVPDGLWIYNNTIYATSTSANLFSVIQNEVGNMTGSVFEIKNNIFYAPNTSNGNSLITNLVGATINVGGTSNSASTERTTSPNFATMPPVAAAHFKPITGSYAIGRGVTVPVWSDYFGVSTGSTRDIGAIRH